MQPAHSVALYSPKGGAGSSTLAVLLAAYWASLGLRTLLADMTHFGGAAALLRVNSLGRGLAALLTAMRQPDIDTDELSAYLQEAAVAVGAGFHLLAGAGPDVRCEERDGRLLMAAAVPYDAVLVDLPPVLDGGRRAALLLASQVALLVSPEVAGVWAGVQALQSLRAAGCAPERVGAVFSRWTESLAIDRHEVLEVLGIPSLGMMPDLGHRVAAAANRGDVVSLARAGEVRRPLSRLTAHLHPDAARRERRRRMWPWSR